MPRAKLYVGEGCAPCEEVKQMVEAGQFTSDVEDLEVEVVDVTTEEGFPEIERENLSRVPSAKVDGRFCRLDIDRETRTVHISCNE